MAWVHPRALWAPFKRLPLTLGRDDSCEIVLGGAQTSRRHAQLVSEGPLIVVRDLGSRNGVFVNGRRVEVARLEPEHVLRIGDWVGVCKAASPQRAQVGSDFRELAPEWFGGARLADATAAAERAAPSSLPIVVQGETGTGKEGLCRAIHDWSGRSGPFVAVNCAALPTELAEAELFGYRRGAFTGAEQPSLGYFRSAHGGTLLLDEVTELPLSLQAKLLRALEQREIQPLGQAQAMPIDVRILAATQEPLSRAVANQRFRADLLSRLDGLTIVLPALRERREDVLPLLCKFLARAAGGQCPELEPRFAEALVLYAWPLNVRELSLLAGRLLALHGHEPLFRASFLPERMRPEGLGPRNRPERVPTDDGDAFDALVEALRRHEGNISRAALALGISRARAYRLLDAHPDFELAALRTEQGLPS